MQIVEKNEPALVNLPPLSYLHRPANIYADSLAARETRSLFNQQWLRLQHLLQPLPAPNTSTRAGSNATASSSRIAKDGFKRRTCRRQCRLSVGNKEEPNRPSRLLSLKLHLTIPLFNEEEDQKRRAAERINNCATLIQYEFGRLRRRV